MAIGGTEQIEEIKEEAWSNVKAWSDRERATVSDQLSHPEHFEFKEEEQTRQSRSQPNDQESNKPMSSRSTVKSREKNDLLLAAARMLKRLSI